MASPSHQTARRSAPYLTSWLEATRASVRPATARRYEQYVRVHAAPTLARIPLTRLTAQHLQALYAERLAAGSSATTVAHLHAVLHRALEQATLWGMCARNVAVVATPPRISRRQMTALSPDQARALLAAIVGDRREALYVLALTSGMRQGELLGLRWADVDLDRRSVYVHASLQRSAEGMAFVEPKTSRSRRQISLTDAATAALRRHRTTQLEERLALGAAWNDLDLVFPNTIGRPLEASNVLKGFRGTLERVGTPRIRFHDLRHTAATLLLAQGVHPKIVSEMLGHSQIAVTLDLYLHVTPTMQRGAAAAMDALLS